MLLASFVCDYWTLKVHVAAPALRPLVVKAVTSSRQTPTGSALPTGKLGLVFEPVPFDWPLTNHTYVRFPTFPATEAVTFMEEPALASPIVR